MRVLGRRLRRFLRPQAQDPDLDEALERATAKLDPRIRQMPAWPEQYLAPLLGALQQTRRVADAIPGSVQVDVAQYSRNPLVHALFGDADDVRQLLYCNPVLQDDTGRSVYALLSVRRMEKHTLSVEADDDTLNRDVQQRLVWFTDPKISGPAPSEAEARKLLMWTLYDRFLARVLIGVQHIEADYQRLLHDRDEVLRQLQKAEGQAYHELQTSLDQIIRQLTETAQALAPETRADIVEAVLSHPEDCLYTETDDLILDTMGVVRASEGQSANRLQFTQLYERYQEPRTVTLIHCTGMGLNR